MTSAVELCNRALAELHVNSINSLTEASAQAQRCKLQYNSTVEYLLKSFDWQFNHKVKPLSLLTDTIHNWVYVYQYPSDCVYINNVLPDYAEFSSESQASPIASRYYDRGLPELSKAKVKYNVYNVNGNKVIAANEKNLRIDYRAKETNPDMFDIDFQDALVYLLASRIATSIIGVKDGAKVRNEMLQLFQIIVNDAADNAENQQHSEMPDSEFITVRN